MPSLAYIQISPVRQERAATGVPERGKNSDGGFAAKFFIAGYNHVDISLHSEGLRCRKNEQQAERIGANRSLGHSRYVARSTRTPAETLPERRRCRTTHRDVPSSPAPGIA